MKQRIDPLVVIGYVLGAIGIIYSVTKIIMDNLSV
jgi:hypothetical protein